MEGFSPARAFHRISEGVNGTAMNAWAELERADRWGLAFHVSGLRHDPAAVARGAERVARGVAIDRSLAHLAGSTDGELLAELRASGLDAPSAADVLAYLRAEAPWDQIIAR
jgi:hypothetical protein